MNEQTLLLRQVNPNFIQDGEATSQAFTPFPKDKGNLSVDDGDQTSPQASFQYFTQILGFASAGVWAVNGAEVHGTGLTYRPDPIPDKTDTPGNPAHALIEFGTRSDKECRKLAKILKRHASARGGLYTEN